MTVVAIYARKSTDNEAGVERQVALATDFIRARGWALGPAFTDNDVSGAIFDRPGLNALLAAISTQPRPFDVLVMMDGSRLGRDMVETLSLQLRIIRGGIRIFHYQERQELVISTPTQKLVASVANFSHEDYRYQIQQKVRAALRKKAEQGHATGARTYGYRRVPQGVGLGKHGADKHTHVLLKIVPEQAAVVKRIFEMAAAGHGDRRISNLLLTEGVPASGDARGWSKDAVRRVLKNEVYVGVQH